MQDELETMPLPADQDDWFAEADATDDTADDEEIEEEGDEMMDDADEMTDDEADVDETVAAGEGNEDASDA
jgi:hypothetical protein